MPTIRCPNCDDQVEIEDDWYGRRLECPSCGKTFTPQRGNRSDGDDRPSRRREYDDRPRHRDRDDRDDDRDDDRPRRRNRYDDGPTKKKGNGVLWLVLTLVGVFVVLPCAGCVGLVVWGMNAKETFNGPWTDQSVGANAEVTASFPKPAKPKYMTIASSTSGEVTGYDNQNDGDNALEAVFAIGYFDFPAGGGDPLTTHFNDIRQAFETTFEVAPFIAADIDTDTRTTHYGFPTREAIYSKEDGSHTLRVIHINNRPPGSPARLVVVFAGGINLKPEDKQKFLNSVKIGKK